MKLLHKYLGTIAVLLSINKIKKIWKMIKRLIDQKIKTRDYISNQTDMK